MFLLPSLKLQWTRFGLLFTHALETNSFKPLCRYFNEGRALILLGRSELLTAAAEKQVLFKMTCLLVGSSSMQVIMRVVKMQQNEEGKATVIGTWGENTAEWWLRWLPATNASVRVQVQCKLQWNNTIRNQAQVLNRRSCIDKLRAMVKTAFWKLKTMCLLFLYVEHCLLDNICNNHVPIKASGTCNGNTE